MKKLIFVALLFALICPIESNAKVTFKDWMTKGLLTNIKELKKEKKLREIEAKGLEAEIVSESTGEGSTEGLFVGEERDDSPQSDYEADSEEEPLFIMLDVTDPQFDWSQFENKNSSALMTEHGLKLVNKKQEFSALSVVELPFDVDNDRFKFMLRIIVPGKKIKKENGVGLVFDYSDNRNYKVIMVNSSQYSLINYKDGVEHVVKTGLIKLPDYNFLLGIAKEGNVMYLYVNNVEYAKFNKISIEDSNFGVMLSGKQDILVSHFVFDIEEDEESEQSTTPN